MQLLRRPDKRIKNLKELKFLWNKYKLSKNSNEKIIIMSEIKRLQKQLKKLKQNKNTKNDIRALGTVEYFRRKNNNKLQLTKTE